MSVRSKCVSDTIVRNRENCLCEENRATKIYDSGIDEHSTGERGYAVMFMTYGHHERIPYKRCF